MLRYICLILFGLLTITQSDIQACSACKITIDGRTYFCNNEDNWRLGSNIWFEPGKDGRLGVAFFGYSDYLPQGGVNEAGLAFDALKIHRKAIKNTLQLPQISGAEGFFREVMTTCKSVDDVSRLASQYYRNGLNGGVFIFADKSGRYLVMEPDTLLVGNDATYALANFCPSSTPEDERREFKRYAHAKDYFNQLPNWPDSLVCRKALDTMHVCREKQGDGTLHSYIADLQQLKIQLFFYHDYTRSVTFDLREEWQKGEHRYDIATLFPENEEYERLLNYLTPFNTAKLQWAMIIALLFLGLLGILETWLYFRKKKTRIAGSIAAMSFTGALMIVVLLLDQSVYFFSFPYQGISGWLMNILPTVFAVFTGMSIWQVMTRLHDAPGWSKPLKALGLFLCVILISAGQYWGIFPW